MHHLECFASMCGGEYGFFLGGESLPGFKKLLKDDQAIVMKALPAALSDAKKAKKAKRESKTGGKDSLEATIEAQNKEYFRIRDIIQKYPAKNLKNFLVANGSGAPEDVLLLLDRSADFLTFGALEKCKHCPQGDLIFSKQGYSCNGMVNEWIECSNVEEKPLRKMCKIPAAIKEQLPDYTPQVQDRAFRPGTVVVVDPAKEDEQKRIVRVQRKREPLYNFHVVAVGTLSITRPVLKAKIEKMGGKLVTTLHKMIAVVISNEREVEKMNMRMREVEALDIQVVGVDFLDKIEGGSPLDTMEKIKKMSICDWGSDPMLRMPPEEIKGPRVSIKTFNFYQP